MRSNVTLSSSMGSEDCSVLIIHNVIAPYRLPLFELLSNYIDLHVYFCETTRPDRKWEADIGQYDFEYTIGHPYQIGSLLFNFEIAALFRQHDFDVCIVGENISTAPTSVFAISLSKITDTRLVLWTEVRKPGSTYLKLESNFRTTLRAGIKQYRKMLYRFVDSFIALSCDAEQYLISQGIRSEQIDTGSQVMPSTLLPKCKEPKKTDNFRILSLGYLRERKGFHHLIQAYRQIRGQHDNVELIIAGIGPYEEKLKSLASGIPEIRFLGYVSEDSKFNLYRSADVFVLPTLNDTWGLVINEALYFSTPVITTDEAGSRELIKNNDAGIVISAGDVDELANSLNQLISNPNQLGDMEQHAETISEAWKLQTGIFPFIKSLGRYCSNVDQLEEPI